MEEKKPSTYTGYTKARKAANAKYEAETVERISLVLPKGKKAIIAATAVIAALALLLIYGSVTKTEKQSEEQSTQNILEKN